MVETKNITVIIIKKKESCQCIIVLRVVNTMEIG